MIERKPSLRRPLALLIAGMAIASHQPAQAQTCVYNFSYYDDAYVSSDGLSLYSSVSVVDHSGCNHSQYTTTAQIFTPSGRSNYTTTNGLGSTTSIALDGETGSFTTSTSGNFYCPVLAGFAGFGDGWAIVVAERTTYYKDATGGEGYACVWHSLACASGTPSCANGLDFGLYLGKCPDPVKATYLVLIVNGEDECDPLPISVDPVMGGGNCT